MTEALHVYEGIITAFQVVSDRVREALAPFKITPAQFGLLRRVGDDEAVSLTELARRLRCTNPNVTRLVENMVKAGLVEKLRHPSDQRIAPIRLTARGAEVRDAAGAAYSRAVDEFVSRLGEEERSALLALRSRLG
ncbi:MAG TPA: MarR family transcriptional regulator [Actinomycetota bacterium]|jgi:DNA-binding MarR family transcriptional regulator